MPFLFRSLLTFFSALSNSPLFAVFSSGVDASRGGGGLVWGGMQAFFFLVGLDFFRWHFFFFVGLFFLDYRSFSPIWMDEPLPPVLFTEGGAIYPVVHQSYLLFSTPPCCGFSDFFFCE